MDELIGKKFRRNKYGLSIWEDTITSVELSYRLLYPISVKDYEPFVEYFLAKKEQGKKGLIPYIMINDKYNLDEIIVYP
jgi:hypothetical protein